MGQRPPFSVLGFRCDKESDHITQHRGPAKAKVERGEIHCHSIGRCCSRPSSTTTSVKSAGNVEIIANWGHVHDKFLKVTRIVTLVDKVAEIDQLLPFHLES